MTHASIALGSRDSRIARALNDVRRNYSLTEKPGAGAHRVFAISGGTKPYTVRVHPDWSDAPACTCPDYSDGARASGGYCKHIIAVLVSHDAFSCQLLPLFL